ncbi:MAG: TRAP transporter small permease [Rhodospirillales bacterium]|nr:TRAP transporter small permease [Rhodospirillales bacterium]
MPADRAAARAAVRALAAWNRLERLVVGLLGVAALTIGLLQVGGRYLDPQRAISYAEEVIVYLVIWAVMIVASQLAASDGHVRPDLVLRVLPPAAQRWVEVFNCLVALAFCGGLLWYGWQIVATALLLDERSSTDLQFPMWLYYLALPVGGGLMGIRYLIRLWRYLLRYDAATMQVGHTLADAPLDMTPGETR